MYVRIYTHKPAFLTGHVEVVKFLLEACKVNPFPKDRWVVLCPAGGRRMLEQEERGLESGVFTSCWTYKVFARFLSLVWSACRTVITERRELALLVLLAPC